MLTHQGQSLLLYFLVQLFNFKVSLLHQFVQSAIFINDLPKLLLEELVFILQQSEVETNEKIITEASLGALWAPDNKAYTSALGTAYKDSNSQYIVHCRNSSMQDVEVTNSMKKGRLETFQQVGKRSESEVQDLSKDQMTTTCPHQPYSILTLSVSSTPTNSIYN